MSKKIYMTEAQFKACCKKRLSEITLSGDQALSSNNGNIMNAVKDVNKDAVKNGVDMSSKDATVSFSGDALKANNVCEGKTITKGEVEKARLDALLSECTVYTKGKLMKRLNRR